VLPVLFVLGSDQCSAALSTRADSRRVVPVDLVPGMIASNALQVASASRLAGCRRSSRDPDLPRADAATWPSAICLRRHDLLVMRVVTTSAVFLLVTSLFGRGPLLVGDGRADGDRLLGEPIADGLRVRGPTVEGSPTLRPLLQGASS